MRGLYPFALQNERTTQHTSSLTAAQFDELSAQGKFVTLVGERLTVLLAEMNDAAASEQTFRKVLGDQFLLGSRQMKPLG